MFRPRTAGFILNPKAGRRKIEAWDREIRKGLEGLNVSAELVRTREPGHAGEIAARLSREHELVVAVGGDGTVHEVAQGVVGTQAVLGLVPNGSGNDFNRYLGMSSNIAAAVRSLFEGCERISVDIGQLTVLESDSRTPVMRWVINSAGMGFDAAVAVRRDRITFLKGLPLYLTSAMWTLWDYKGHDFLVEVDGLAPIKFNGLMVCAGLGQFEGGGFKVFPGARHDDGELDVCWVESMPKIQALGLLGKAVVGAHVGNRRVGYVRSKQLVVESGDPYCVHCDGEIVSTRAVKASMNIVQNNLFVVKPLVS